MSKTKKHTPTLSIGLESDNEQTQLINEHGQHVCYIELDPHKVTAKHIVRCVNSHDELVDLLKLTHDLLEGSTVNKQQDFLLTEIEQALKKAGA